jgi:hypothetical protein
MYRVHSVSPAAILSRGKPVTMMRETVLLGEFPASLMFDDIEPEVLAEEDAGPITWSVPVAARGGWRGNLRPVRADMVTLDMQPTPHRVALFLLATRSAQGARCYVGALQARAARSDDLGQAHFWQDVLTELGRIATGS